MTKGDETDDHRVLLLIPARRDAVLARETLSAAGLRAQLCEGMEALDRAVQEGAGAVLVAQEALTPPALHRLTQILAQQPPWSDLPLVVLTTGRAAAERAAAGEAAVGGAAPDDVPRFEGLGNATFLERPLRMATLVRALQAALRARRRQYELREHLREREEAAARIAALLRQQRAFLRDVLASVTAGKLRLCETAEELPPPLPPAGAPVALSATSLRPLRKRVEAAARAQGLDRDRSHDLLTAAGEAAMNAIVHAGGGRARVGACSASGTIQVWVEDRGAGIAIDRLPRAALERGYSSAGTLGHGFWLMLNTVDRVYLRTGAEGTTVVLEQERTPPEPAWQRVG